MVKTVLSLADLNGSNGFRINGIDSWDNSGVSVSAAGDINGDGFDDIIIGAAGANAGGNLDAGETYVVFGAQNWTSAAIELSQLIGTNGFKINGIGKGDNSGGSVSAAGDVNGDGIDDIIIGAAGAVGSGEEDESYVVFGAQNWSDPSIELSGLTGANGFKITGIHQGSSSGLSVSSAGDVNNDGISDIIIGAAGATANGRVAAGETYVIFGAGSWSDPSIDLSSLNGTNGFRITGIDEYDASGVSVSYAGDVNGDGNDDIIIGAHNAAPNDVISGKMYPGAGETYVVFGYSALASASIDLSSLNGTNGFRINGIDELDRSGRSVSFAGDVNGDEIDDIIIGAYLADAGGTINSGQSYVVFGAKSWSDPSIELTTLDGTDGFKINGSQQGDFSGSSVSGAGDVNGDGIDDIIIGASGADPNDGSEAGESYVIFGAQGWSSASIDLSLLDAKDGFQINGIGTDNWSGGSVSHAGDVNGDGFDDVIIGARFSDTNDSVHSGQSYVVFGQRVNSELSGTVAIIGTASQGSELSVDTTTLADADGLGVLSYQWKANGVAIVGATFSTLTPSQSEVGKAITVVVSYTDAGGTGENLTSEATPPIADINYAPTGPVTISGTASQGNELTADTTTLADADGLGNFNYQWKAADEDIVGETSSTLTLSQLEVGKAITVVVSYTDGGGVAESLTSAATGLVTNANSDPTGSVTISGTAHLGRVLTADTTALADADGGPPANLSYDWETDGSDVDLYLSYQWQADGVDITGATSSGLTLGQSEVGKVITVVVSYIDAGGTLESVTSRATGQVIPVFTGPVTIVGSASQRSELTADTTILADADGLGVLSYEWKANDVAIVGATSSTLTPSQYEVGKAITVVVRYTDDGGTDESATSAATTFVADVNDDATGTVKIIGTASQGNELTADTTTLADADGLGLLSYQWKADGEVIVGEASDTLTLSEPEVGKAITVVVSYTDGGGFDESLTSAATPQITPENSAPTGRVEIIGTTGQGSELTANTTTLADADGRGVLSYEWKANDVAIVGATSSTFTPSQSEVGKAITVVVSYADDGRTYESATSAATAAVADVNDNPTGSVTIIGIVRQGEELTADTTTLADADVLGVFSYQWKADGGVIVGATSDTLTLSQSEVGKAITVVVSYADGGGFDESLTSVPTVAVLDVNDNPTGSVTISGTASLGYELTADIATLADADVLGVLSYQWKADGEAIVGATFDTLTPSQSEVGKAITVVVSYTDGGGFDGTKASEATGLVTPQNSDPTGSVTIIGTETQGDVLTADITTLADADGLSVLSYEWKADGTVIAGATTSTLTLSQSEVGKAITVVVSYADAGGTDENLTSAATVAVADVNDDPTGSVTISGTARQGNELTADIATLADADVLGVFNYQWKADGEVIVGATSDTLTLSQSEVGKAITVVVSYTDGGGFDESLTSAATGLVTPENSDPTGSVTIIGTVTQGEVLTADTMTLDDADGPGVLSYEWKADGEVILGATSDTLTLSQSEVGKAITVVVSYADAGGTDENPTSAATEAVADVNDDPTGSVTIIGTASQGEVLTAETMTLDDADGPSVLSYEWKADDVAIAGATTSTLTLSQSEVGKAITVVVSYEDGGGFAESLTSVPTVAVVDVNDDPTGPVTISGIARQGNELTAVTTILVDADGLGDLSYQWKADGEAIAGEASDTLTLSEPEVGKAITVVVSYTDGGSFAESLTSVATPKITPENSAPTGSVTISGIAGNELMAITTALADADVLGDLSYQWLRDGADILDATSNSYELGDNDGGTVINVKVSYTDGNGTNELMTSDATDEVNYKPIIENALASFFVVEGTPKSSAGTGIVFFDADNELLDVEITLEKGGVKPDWVDVNTETGVLTVTEIAVAGQYHLKATATDDDGASVSNTFSIFVQKDNVENVLKVFDNTGTAADNNQWTKAFGDNIVVAGQGNDSVVNFSGSSFFDGGDGDDFIIGGSGDDILIGGSGDDVLIGDISMMFSPGDDILIAGAGNDFLEGREGADTFVFKANDGINVIARLEKDTNDLWAAVGADFNVSKDFIDLSVFGFVTKNKALDKWSDDTDGAHFIYEETDILLFGVHVADLVADNFII